MEPTLTTISSLTGLLATYLQERESKRTANERATLEEYKEWLRRAEHSEAVTLLQENRDIATAVQGLLSGSHDELLARFDRLESNLVTVLSSIPDWSAVTRALFPNGGLSEQAIDFLRWFDGSRSDKVIEVKSGAGTLFIHEGRGEKFVPKEPRFINDDLEMLVQLGFVIPGFTSTGSPKFSITRSGVAFIQQLSDAPGNG